MLIIHVSPSHMLAKAKSAVAEKQLERSISMTSPPDLFASFLRIQAVEAPSLVLSSPVSMSLDASDGKSSLTMVFEILIFRPVRGFLTSGLAIGDDILFLLRS